MVDFADIANTIADVITSEGLGATVTLTSVAPGAYDPATGGVATTTTTATLSAIVGDYGGLSLLSGLVQAGDKKVEIPAAQLSSAPKLTDKVTIAGVVHAVVAVKLDEAGGVPILYTLQCRRA